MKFPFFVILLLALINGQSRIGDWESITSPLNIRQLVFDRGSVYCATDGGVLIYHPDTDRFETLTNLDGLARTDIQAIAIDQDGAIWTGGASPVGIINRLDREEQNNQLTLDLGLTEIGSFTVSDSLLFAVFKQNQDMGLIQFVKQTDNFQYRDVFKNWPAGVQTITGAVISGTRIFIGTNQGLWEADLVASNLKNPAAWFRPFPEIAGSIIHLKTWRSELIVQANTSVYRINLQNNITVLVDPSAPSDLVDMLPVSETEIFYLSHTSLYLREGDHNRYHISIPRYRLTSLASDSILGIIAGSTHGLALVDTSNRTVNWKIPNAPIAPIHTPTKNEGGFTAATVMSDGRIVVASNKGIAIRDPEGWRNIMESTDNRVSIAENRDYSFFIADSIPVDFGGFVADLEEGPDGLLYCAIRGTFPEPYRHGGGIIILDIDHPQSFTLIDTTYLDYFTTASNSNPYMVVKDVAFDRNDALWVADTYATNRKRPVQVRDTDGNWGGYYSDSTGVLLPLTPVTIGFDAWNRVWVGSFREGDEFTRSGLYVLQYSGSPAFPDSYSWLKIGGLIDDTIWSLGVTRDNRLYYLTPQGLNYLDLQYNPSAPVLRSGTFTYFPNISYGDGAKIRLDSRDNVWTVSPSDGINVLLSNTTYWPDNDPDLAVEGITAETTPLLSDEVTDIAFDEEKGLAYITSKRGLNVLKIPFTNQRKSYSTVRIFPSPFRIPSDQPMVIDRLPDQSSAMIMTLNGQVIRKLAGTRDNSGGDQLFWDGRDEQGNWVRTGVYLVALTTPGGNRDIQKIAVVKN
ncbi:MAG: hypothetical protein GXO90_04860 [FCB group bacterium]|nr:hypothetical protein [FCB group bacterium]